MEQKDRQELISDLAKNEAQYQLLVEAKQRQLIPAKALDEVPYHQLSPEERRRRMSRARPADWGSDEQITSQNFLAVQTMGIDASQGVDQ